MRAAAATGVRLLQRWLSLLPAVTVVACALLAGHAASALIATRLPSAAPPPRAAPRPVKPPPPRPPKDAAAVVARNMFCATCDPAPAAAAAAPAAGGDGRPPATSLPLALIAIFSAPDGAATIADTASGRSGLYAVGDRLPGAGPLRRIRGASVEFWNAAAGRVERIDLVAAAAAPPPGAVPRPPVPVAAADPGVHRIDDRHYQLERGMVDQVLADPMVLARSARVLPVVESGKTQGFRLVGLRADSLLAKIGLQNGDVIRSVNGFELSSPDKVLEAYTRLRSASTLALSVARGGAPVELQYAIR